MEHHLRLAEARGSLRAPNSPVQDRALGMVLLLAEKRHQEGRADALKQAILIARPTPEEVYQRFPEFFPPDFMEQMTLAKATGPNGELDIDLIDDSQINWKTEGITEEEDLDLERWIRERETGSVTLDDIDNGWR